MQYQRPDGSSRDFFTYAANPFVFAAAGTLPFNIPIQSDADFELAYLTANASSAVLPSWTLQISDQSSNLVLSNIPIDGDLITGNGQRPFVLPETHVFGRNGAILLQVTNLVAGANTINVVLHGWKWWRRPPGLVTQLG
jgi:hypothetical protein